MFVLIKFNFSVNQKLYNNYINIWLANTYIVYRKRLTGPEKKTEVKIRNTKK